MKPVLITCYVNPDLDGVAGAIGYAEFLSKTGKTCEAGIIGELHDEPKYMLDRFGFPYPQSIPNADNYDEVILVDASDLNGLEGKIAPEKVIEIIDHRKVHEADKFQNAKVQIEFVGAATTLIAEKFMQNNIPISKESATLIYGAIISNTLNFKGTVTTDRDKKAAEWLNQVAQLHQSFARELFVAKSDLSGAKLAERIESDFAWFTMGSKKVGIAQIEMIGATKLIDERGSEITQTLDKIKSEMNLDFVFQNTIELEEPKNLFVTDNEPTKALLKKVLNAKFSGIVATRPNLIMRKQIVPLLKEELEEVTRPEEELQTLRKFIENQGRDFIPEKAIQDRAQLKEPADVLYEGIGYQITYGDAAQLGESRKITSVRRKDNPQLSETYSNVRHIVEPKYAEMCLKNALENKKNKSDKNMTLLIHCVSTSYETLENRGDLCKKYFSSNESTLGGSWEHIFAIFPDGNIQLR